MPEKYTSLFVACGIPLTTTGVVKVDWRRLIPGLFMGTVTGALLVYTTGITNKANISNMVKAVKGLQKTTADLTVVVAQTSRLPSKVDGLSDRVSHLESDVEYLKK